MGLTPRSFSSSAAIAFLLDGPITSCGDRPAVAARRMHPSGVKIAPALILVAAAAAGCVGPPRVEPRPASIDEGPAVELHSPRSQPAIVRTEPNERVEVRIAAPADGARIALGA